MTNVVARKYVKALILTYTSDEVSVVHTSLVKIASALNIQKLRFIMVSNDVSHAQKASLLVEIAENNDSKFANFIRLVVDKQKIDFVPSMAEELRKHIASKKGSVSGVVTANFNITTELKNSLEASLSRKLNKQVVLAVDAHPAHEFNGIKIDLDDIGVEVEIEKTKLKNEIIEHILKSDKIL
jgi:F-type H+-transporting ATPase subunit delta